MVKMEPRQEAAPAANSVIEIAGLNKSFKGHLGIGKTTAVASLDLEIREGEVFGLLGPNGAGKTTTLKMMLGLLRPDRGEVRLFGRPPSDPASRSRLGYLPENPYFYDHLTAAEFLDFYARLHGMPAAERREKISATLKRVGLGGRENIALRKCSKGMTQRVGLAQAIQHDPELVILDEPMSGLDPIGRREVRDLILSLRDAGKTVFFSSHILQDAEMICDRVAILEQGNLRSVGRLSEMISTSVRFVEVVVRGPVPKMLLGSCRSRDENESLIRIDRTGELPAALAALDAVGAEVLSVWTRRDTLEDLFLRTLGKTPGGETEGES
jgi:ABC-2 type transport system ATP-binding protein